MRSAFVIGLTCLAFSSASHGATNAGIEQPVFDRAETAIDAGLYYTRAEIEVTNVALPPTDSSDRKRLGRAIMKAFGLGEETRALTVSVASAPGSAPSAIEYPLITFKFDKNQALVDSRVVGKVLMPQARLAPSDAYMVDLKYHDAQSSDFDIVGAANNLLAMVPGTTLISAATQPFLQRVGNVAGSVLSAMGSRTANSSRKDPFTPYRANGGNRGAVYRLVTPDGVPLATITVKLAVSPTLARTPMSISGRSASDFRLAPGEDPALLAVDVGGVRRRMVTEAQGLPSYVKASRERTVTSVADFCKEARGKLEADYALTRMDRALVMHQALVEAQFDETDTAWYFACFNPDERAGLLAAFGRAPTVSDISPGGFSSTALAVDVKYLLGCLATAKSGPQCTSRAPDIRAAVAAVLAEKVTMAPIELTSVDVSGLPANKQATREQVLDLIAGKAEDFACFSYGSRHGLLLKTEEGQKVYELLTRSVDGRIVAVALLAAPATSYSCTG